jgi:hypothetical protein
MRTTAGHRRACIGAALALLVTIAACSPQRDSTPLPTRQTAIDPVVKKLDAAGEQEQKRREEMEAAAKH